MELTKKQIEAIKSLLEKDKKTEIEIYACVKSSQGYHSQGFIIKTSHGNFFAKVSKGFGFGLETYPRRLESFATSYIMNQNHIATPRALGVISGGKESYQLLEISESNQVIQVQEYVDLGQDYKTYLLGLGVNTIKHHQSRFDQIIKLLLGIHRLKIEINPEQKVAIYRSSIRSILTHPELGMTVMHEASYGNDWISLEQQLELLSQIYLFVHKWGKKSERLRYVHGDMNFRNIFFPDGEIRVIDYSRLIMADPGVDVGWITGSLIGMYYQTEEKSFLKLAEYFLEKYISFTKDDEIVSAQILPLTYSFIIQTSPNVNPMFGKEKTSLFYNNIIKLLKTNNWESEIFIF